MSKHAIRAYRAAVSPTEWRTSTDRGYPCVFSANRNGLWNAPASVNGSIHWDGNFGTELQVEECFLLPGVIREDEIQYGEPYSLPNQQLVEPDNYSEPYYQHQGDVSFVDATRFVVTWHANFGERWVMCGTWNPDLSVTFGPAVQFQNYTYASWSTSHGAMGPHVVTMVSDTLGVLVWQYSDFGGYPSTPGTGPDRFKARAFRVNGTSITLGSAIDLPMNRNPSLEMSALPGSLVDVFKLRPNVAIFGGIMMQENFDVWAGLLYIKVNTNLTLTLGTPQFSRSTPGPSIFCPLDEFEIVGVGGGLRYAASVDNVDFYWAEVSRLRVVTDDPKDAQLRQTYAEGTFLPASTNRVGTDCYTPLPFGRDGDGNFCLAVGHGAEERFSSWSDLNQSYWNEDESYAEFPTCGFTIVDFPYSSETNGYGQEVRDAPLYRTGQAQLTSRSRRGVAIGKDGRRCLVPGTSSGRPYVLVKPRPISSASSHGVKGRLRSRGQS